VFVPIRPAVPKTRATASRSWWARIAVAAALIFEIALAATLVTTQRHNPASHSSSKPATSPVDHLTVGDGRTVRLISLGGERTDRLLTRVAADIVGSVAVVEQFWGTDWDHEIVIIATDSESQFVAQAGLDPAREWGDIAAVSVADDVDLVEHRAVGQRIVLAPGASMMSDSALQIVMTHELFHFAARADTALDAPRWLLEGVADYLARPAAPIPREAAAAIKGLPTDADLDVPGPDRSLGYDRAWWFARFVADSYGADALRQLYREACGPGHVEFGAAVQSVLGIDTENLRVAWIRWLSR
jgi:hypothetical protein